jgi:ubiquinone/menaquinone biosynthesis C-methylase UbiE
LNAFEELFSNINGGRVLDVAAGEGGYITILRRYLGNFDSITGLDVNHKVLSIARSAFDIQEIQFTQMNAEMLGFDSNTFDTVNISASLHHLENVSRVLAEMKRVLKSGGKLILTEMHRDGISEEQFNAIRIHHWAASVDSCQGILHDRTFARQEILDFIGEMNLVNMTTRDFPNTESNPMDEKAIARISGYLDRYHQRLVNKSRSEVLLQQEGELRTSLATKGFQREPIVVIIAEKA